jgi:hypothetical protein
MTAEPPEGLNLPHASARFEIRSNQERVNGG